MYIRPYSPLKDHAAVVHICKNVYNGHDYLHLTINSACREANTNVFVLCSTQNDEVNALIATQRRDTALWIWGARTREDRRGEGLCSRLLRHSERHAMEQPLEIASLLSTTIDENLHMRHIFRREGFVEQCRVHTTAPAPRLEPRPEGLTLARCWEVCTSMAKLESALIELRRQRCEALGVDASSQGSAAFCWLPFNSEVCPIHTPFIQGLVEAGNVWLLPGGSSGGSGREALHLGVLVSPPDGAPCSAVAGHPFALEAALAMLAASGGGGDGVKDGVGNEGGRHLTADCCFDGPPDEGILAGMKFLVVHKELNRPVVAKHCAVIP
jgi:hypothetical protein